MMLHSIYWTIWVMFSRVITDQRKINQPGSLNYMFRYLVIGQLIFVFEHWLANCKSTELELVAVMIYVGQAQKHGKSFVLSASLNYVHRDISHTYYLPIDSPKESSNELWKKLPFCKRNQEPLNTCKSKVLSCKLGGGGCKFILGIFEFVLWGFFNRKLKLQSKDCGYFFS